MQLQSDQGREAGTCAPHPLAFRAGEPAYICHNLSCLHLSGAEVREDLASFPPQHSSTTYGVRPKNGKRLSEMLLTLKKMKASLYFLLQCLNASSSLESCLQ